VAGEDEPTEVPGGLAEGAAGARDEDGRLACLVAIANKEEESDEGSAVVESSKVTAVEGLESGASPGEVLCW